MHPSPCHQSRRRALGAAIRRSRLAAGYSQEDLARIVGVRAMTISRYERGLQTLRLDRLEQIAGAVGVDLSSLIA